ncbi:MAG TPA: outer membrane beta-barrel protein [Chitinophagaceae bacterium]
MRAALVLVLLCTCYSHNLHAQQKTTWQFVLELNGTSSRSDVRKNNAAYYYLLDTPNQIFKGLLLEGNSRNSRTIRPGVTGGFTINRSLSKNLAIHAGAMVSFYSFENVTTTSVRTVDTAMTQIPQGATYLPGAFMVLAPQSKSTTIVSAIAIDIPIGIRIRPKASKWIVEAELIPSFTLNSTRRMYQANSEYSSEAPGSIRSTTFAAGIGAAYRLTERFELGIRYRYGFMNVLKDPYPETRVQTIGLQLRYTLPSLF